MNRRSFSEAGLTIITGPMRSGKSHELIRLLTEVPYAGLKAVVFKPKLDKRQSGIASRVGAQIPAHEIEDLSLIPVLAGAADVIGFDESQFFSDELVDAVLALIRAGKHVCVAGLQLGHEGDPFGPIPALMPYATHIDVRTAYCEDCRGEASRSHRTIDDDSAFVVGDDIYKSLCVSCFEAALEERRKLSLQKSVGA